MCSGLSLSSFLSSACSESSGVKRRKHRRADGVGGGMELNHVSAKEKAKLGPMLDWPTAMARPDNSDHYPTRNTFTTVQDKHALPLPTLDPHP